VCQRTSQRTIWRGPADQSQSISGALKLATDGMERGYSNRGPRYNWQEFRDLFASETISPNEQVTIGSQVILFTDLRAQRPCITASGTDPLMPWCGTTSPPLRSDQFASRHCCQDDWRCGLWQCSAAWMRPGDRAGELPATFQRSIRFNKSLLLKCSLHVGPCLAVNANDKLDFFGTTVNLAARMIECCQGAILLSQTNFTNVPKPPVSSSKAAISRSHWKFAIADSILLIGFGESRWIDYEKMDCQRAAFPQGFAVRIVKTIAAMQRLAGQWQRKGTPVAFVPTMGYLHHGISA